MGFHERLMPDINSGCAVLPAGLCGSGVVTPFGHATETIVFGGACSGNCDFRTVNLAGGSIFLDEVFSNPTCPGGSRPRPGAPGSRTPTERNLGRTRNLPRRGRDRGGRGNGRGALGYD